MDGCEDEFDGPFGGQALGFERVGEAEAADREIGAGGAGAGELAVDVLAFADLRAGGQKVEVRADERIVDVGRADLDRGHAAFAGEEAGERDFELAVGEEEDGTAVQRPGGSGDGPAGAGARGGGHGGELRRRNGEFGGDGLQPGGGALFAEGEGRGNVACPAPQERGMRIAKEGLGQGENRIRADGGFGVDPAGGKHADGADSEGFEKRKHLVLDHVGQGADDEEFARRGLAQDRDHGGKRGILALGEGRLDPAAGIVQHADAGRMGGREAFGGAMQVEFDDLGGAGADKEELPDVRPA